MKTALRKKVSAIAIMAIIGLNTTTVMANESPIIYTDTDLDLTEYQPDHSYDSPIVYVNSTTYDYNEMFSPDLYFGRSCYDVEGQKAWDFMLKTLLEYNGYQALAGGIPHVTVTKNNDGNHKVTFHLKEAGINLKKSEVGRLTFDFVRSDPRMFLIRDWSDNYHTNAAGIVDTFTFFIPDRWAVGDAYQKQLIKLDEVAQELLAGVRSDMTPAQKAKVIFDDFKKHCKYNGSGSPSDINGALLGKKAICGGFAKGYMYLAQKAGIPTVWVGANGHAWNLSYIDNAWYSVDATGDSNCLLKGDNFNYSNVGMYRRSPSPTAKVSYDRSLMEYSK